MKAIARVVKNCQTSSHYEFQAMIESRGAYKGFIYLILNRESAKHDLIQDGFIIVNFDPSSPFAHPVPLE